MKIARIEIDRNTLRREGFEQTGAAASVPPNMRPTLAGHDGPQDCTMVISAPPSGPSSWSKLQIGFVDADGQALRFTDPDSGKPFDRFDLNYRELGPFAKLQDDLAREAAKAGGGDVEGLPPLNVREADRYKAEIRAALGQHLDMTGVSDKDKDRFYDLAAAQVNILMTPRTVMARVRTPDSPKPPSDNQPK